MVVNRMTAMFLRHAVDVKEALESQFSRVKKFFIVAETVSELIYVDYMVTGV